MPVMSVKIQPKAAPLMTMKSSKRQRRNVLYHERSMSGNSENIGNVIENNSSNESVVQTGRAKFRRAMKRSLCLSRICRGFVDPVTIRSENCVVLERPFEESVRAYDSTTEETLLFVYSQTLF